MDAQQEDIELSTSHRKVNQPSETVLSQRIKEADVRAEEDNAGGVDIAPADALFDCVFPSGILLAR